MWTIFSTGFFILSLWAYLAEKAGKVIPFYYEGAPLGGMVLSAVFAFGGIYALIRGQRKQL